MQILAQLAEKEYKLAFGKKSHIAILGPANVGKSTLYNQFVRQKRDKAEVGPLPGTTRNNQEADTGLFSIIDTPGADSVGPSGDEERDRAFEAAASADFLIILFDAVQGIKKTELELYHELTLLKKPYIVVLNKCDLIKQSQISAVIKKAATTLNLSENQVIGITAKDGKNLERIIAAIANVEPEICAALGAALPAFRWNLAWQAMVSGAAASGLIGLLPLPVADFIPLVVTQSAMIIAIARIYDYKITVQRARELIATFGIGFLGRTLFYELSKFGGIPGWLLASAIAASTTMAMGYAAVIWFEKGEKLTNESLKQISGNLTAYLLNTLKNRFQQKPSKGNLQEQIAEALNQYPLNKESEFNNAEIKLEGDSQEGNYE
ncbi:MAG: 50S ribosome-binding GTPase [Anaerolineae bacterium]|nr:50S ribosome-binding GTPase [Anaerolineae bacterium]